MLHRTGEQFWQDESYDHVIEDDEETARLVSYVEDNPVKAGLCPRQEDWTWSSARDRWEEWNRNGSGGRHPACQ